MIPNLNKYGLLPKGIHKATIEEIEHKFGSSSAKRKELFIGFQKLIQLLYKHKRSIKSFLLDGSFVTSKESPGDIDCIMSIENNFRFTPEIVEELSNSKRFYNIHLFIFEEKNTQRHRDMLNFFSKDKDLKPKGIIEVIL